MQAMFMVLVVFALSGHCTTVQAEEEKIPADLLESLRADSFDKRTEAEADVTKWALGDENNRRDLIYSWAVQHNDPEIAFRMGKVLRRLSDKAFDVGGSGFVGISMRDIVIDGKDGSPPRRTLFIADTWVGGPAAKAGLQAKDFIISLDGELIEGPNMTKWFIDWLSKKNRSEVIDVLIERKGKELLKKIRLARRPVTTPFRYGVDFQLIEAEDRELFYHSWIAENFDADGQ